MITRYFSPSPEVTGPLAFLAGFGQQRQQVKAAEAGMDFQQGQALSQGIAGAGQGIAQGISGRAQQVARANLQQQRLQADRYQEAADAYRQVGGVPGQPPPGIDFGPAAVGGPPAAGGAPAIGPQRHGAGVLEGPPAPGEPQPIELAAPFAPAQPEPGGVPLPVNQPSAIPQYREAVRKLNLLTNYKGTLDTDPFMPVEEKARKIAALAPHIAATQALIKKQPIPKPPRTNEELIAAGPHGGGFTPLPGTYNHIISDGKGGVKVSTAVHPTDEALWLSIPDPAKRDEAKRAHLESHLQEFDGETYLWDGKNWDKQKPDRDEFDLGEYVGKLSGKETARGVPTTDQLIADGLKVKAAMELARLQDAVQEAPDAEAILNLVKQRAHISPENHERLKALNNADMTRRLRPAELQERADLAEEWLDGLMAMKAAGVQIPLRLQGELLKQKRLLDSYVAAGRR